MGGTESFLYQLLKYINRKKFEPVVISLGTGRALSLFKPLNLSTEIIPIKNGVLDFKKLFATVKHHRPEIL